MIRRIIHIDRDKCNGCGACHEGAIDMVDGKAKLMREHYCGGLEMAARRALEQCGRDLPWQVCTVHIDGTATKN